MSHKRTQAPVKSHESPWLDDIPHKTHFVYIPYSSVHTNNLVMSTDATIFLMVLNEYKLNEYV